MFDYNVTRSRSAASAYVDCARPRMPCAGPRRPGPHDGAACARWGLGSERAVVSPVVDATRYRT